MKYLTSSILFCLEILAFLCLGVLFGLTFIAVQIGSWTGSKS